MSSYHFTLIVEGSDLQTDDHADALFEAGCDDALVGEIDGVHYLDFDREADTVSDAVLSAIGQIESAVPGARVVRVANGGLVSMADIAARTNRTRESVRMLVTGARGPGRFPPPVTDPRGRYRLWRWSEVQRWLVDAFGEEVRSPELGWFEAVNASLELRRSASDLSATDRRRLEDLAGLAS
jgi:hypothetical protein